MKENEMHKIIQEERATISHDTKGCKNIDLEMGNLNTQICTFNTATLLPDLPVLVQTVM